MTYQNNFTLSKALLDQQFLEQLTTSGFDALPTLFQVLLNAAMQIERQKHLGAAPHERTQERTGYANGPFVVAAYWDGVQFPADEHAEARLSPPVHAGVVLSLVRVHGRGGLPGVSRARQERGSEQGREVQQRSQGGFGGGVHRTGFVSCDCRGD